MEHISYDAIAASSALAAERGRYPSFDGSLWSRGILPIDSVHMLADDRGGDLDQDRSTTLDWDALRGTVVAQGMRNSNVLAIAPTATISNIVGVSQSIEPTYRNLFVKSNMSGDFTVVNEHLVRVLKERGLWDEVMVADLKYFDGSLGPIARIPADVKELFATAFEIDGTWLVRAASRRQKWIDQAQSLNLYVASPDGRMLDELYRLAWRSGCKTTYYLRSTSATHVEKSTLRGTDGRLTGVSLTTAPPPARIEPGRPDRRRGPGRVADPPGRGGSGGDPRRARRARADRRTGHRRPCLLDRRSRLRGVPVAVPLEYPIRRNPFRACIDRPRDPEENLR